MWLIFLQPDDVIDYIHLFVYVFGHTHGIQTFLVQGSNLCHSRDLSHSSDNAGSLTHCARPRIEPVIQCSQDTTDLLHNSGNSKNGSFLTELFFTLKILIYGSICNILQLLECLRSFFLSLFF